VGSMAMPSPTIFWENTGSGTVSRGTSIPDKGALTDNFSSIGGAFAQRGWGPGRVLLLDGICLPRCRTEVRGTELLNRSQLVQEMQTPALLLSGSEEDTEDIWNRNGEDATGEASR